MRTIIMAVVTLFAVSAFAAESQTQAPAQAQITSIPAAQTEVVAKHKHHKKHKKHVAPSASPAPAAK